MSAAMVQRVQAGLTAVPQVDSASTTMMVMAAGAHPTFERTTVNFQIVSSSLPEVADRAARALGTAAIGPGLVAKAADLRAAMAAVVTTKKSLAMVAREEHKTPAAAEVPVASTASDTTATMAQAVPMVSVDQAAVEVLAVTTPVPVEVAEARATMVVAAVVQAARTRAKSWAAVAAAAGVRMWSPAQPTSACGADGSRKRLMAS